jgi:hypothetical protein
VTSGSDPQSGIKEIRIMKKEAVLQNGSCGTFDIAWSLGGTYSPAATEVEVPVSADKCYNFSMVVENNAGLTSAYYNSTIVKVDYVSPVTTDRIPAGWVSSPFYAELTCNDTGSGCDGTYYCKYRIGSQPASTCSDVNNWHRATALAQCASGTTCFQVDNDCNDGEKCNYSVSYYSIDRAGSQELANTVTARINKQDPSCDISLPPRYSKTSSITLSWSGSDPAQSGIKTYSIYYRNDSSLDRVLWLSTSSASGTFTGQANHTFTFTCEATNNLDQTGAPSQDRVVTIDSTPPYVAITGLPTWVNETSFELRWTATDFGTGSGIASYTPEYRVTNSTGIVSDWASLGNVLPPLTSATLAGMQSNYTYYFRVNATDNAGNNGTSAAMSTRADLELPVCNVGNLQGWVTASPFVISWSGTDNVSGIKSYTVQSSKDNFTTISTVGQEATNTTANIAVENGFTYYFRCIATDNALNTGVWSTAKTTNADLVKPAVTASYRQYVTTGGDQIINVTATDTNMDSLVLALDGSAVQPDFESVEDTMIISSWRLDNPSTGAHTFQLTATDKGGNTNRTSFSFSVAPCAEGAIRPCGSNNGVCRAGNQTCSNGQWGSCTGGVAPCNCSRSDAACLGSCVETCNNLDDDCDAQVDENLTQQCGSSIGRCQKGTQICAAGQWGQCQGGIGPASETCGNGLDDNCDGSIDEGCACTPGSTQPCGQSNTAPCHFGAQTCSSSGQWGTCAGAADPATEVCGNNADDDCDGQTDEGCACTGVDCGQNPSALPDWLSTALLAAGAVMLVVIVVLFLVFRKKGKELTWEEISKKWTGAKY